MYTNSEFTGYMVDESSSTTKPFDYSSIYRSKGFQEAMNYFDITDEMTRKVLLSVNEADQNIIMQALANKLYGHIVDRVDDIDFGTIPLSRGDITKIDNYEQLTDCINILRDILQNYKQPLDSIDTIAIALENLIDRKDFFVRAYKLNVEMPIVTYNTIALSIVAAVSFMITSSIEFIKLPGDGGFNIAMSRASKVKSKDHVLFSNLSKFNKSCSDGSFDKTMGFIVKNNIAVHREGVADILFNAGTKIAGATPGPIGAAVKVGNAVAKVGLAAAAHPKITAAVVGAAISAAILPVMILIVKFIRNLIYFSYYARVKVSDYFDAQSALLMMNAYNVENNLTRDEKHRKEIADNQRKIAEFFKKVSNKLNVAEKVASSKGAKDIDKEENEKLKYNDVIDGIPDSSQSILF